MQGETVSIQTQQDESGTFCRHACCEDPSNSGQQLQLVRLSRECMDFIFLESHPLGNKQSCNGFY